MSDGERLRSGLRRLFPIERDGPRRERGIRNGQMVRLSNERGWCRMVADVSEEIRSGVLSCESVWWPKFSPDQRNVNWTTPDRLADFQGGSTFYANLVTVVAESSL